MAGGDNWGGRVSYYRFHIEDPIMFEESIKVTIEHGHANHRSDDIPAPLTGTRPSPMRRATN